MTTIHSDEILALASNMRDQAKRMGATACEVDISISESLSVTVRQQAVETTTFHCDKSLSLTYYSGQKKSTVSTTDFAPDSLSAVLMRARDLSEIVEPDPCHGLADSALLATEIIDCDLDHAWHITPEEAITLAMRAEQAAFDTDRRIVNSEGATTYTTRGYCCYANSNGFLAGFPATKHGLNCVILAQSGESMERDYDYTVSRQAEGLADPEKVGRTAAEKAVARLNPRVLKTAMVPVIFHHSIAASLLGHYFSAISGGALFRKASFLCDSLDSRVFPESFQILEYPHIKAGLGSVPFDDEGVQKRDMALVENGVVKSYLLGSYSARKLNLKSTGHAGGVSNIRLQHNRQDTLPAILKEMNQGFLIMEVMGPGVNLVTGDYSRGASGFWIEGGEIQYPVHGITVASNLKDMFNHIWMVGTDVETRSSVQTGSIALPNMTLAGA